MKNLIYTSKRWLAICFSLNWLSSGKASALVRGAMFESRTRENTVDRRPSFRKLQTQGGMDDTDPTDENSTTIQFNFSVPESFNNADVPDYLLHCDDPVEVNFRFVTDPAVRCDVDTNEWILSALHPEKTPWHCRNFEDWFTEDPEDWPLYELGDEYEPCYLWELLYGFLGTSIGPIGSPSRSPTKSPSSLPTTSPTKSPSSLPTTSPTESPSSFPTNSPTWSPSNFPTNSPTTTPSVVPTDRPTFFPTREPKRMGMRTSSPSPSPSLFPSAVPSIPEPSGSPSSSPSLEPTSLEPTSLEPTPLDTTIVEFSTIMMTYWIAPPPTRRRLFSADRGKLGSITTSHVFEELITLYGDNSIQEVQLQVTSIEAKVMEDSSLTTTEAIMGSLVIATSLLSTVDEKEIAESVDESFEGDALGRYLFKLQTSDDGVLQRTQRLEVGLPQGVIIGDTNSVIQDESLDDDDDQSLETLVVDFFWSTTGMVCLVAGAVVILSLTLMCVLCCIHKDLFPDEPETDPKALEVQATNSGSDESAEQKFQRYIAEVEGNAVENSSQIGIDDQQSEVTSTYSYLESNRGGGNIIDENSLAPSFMYGFDGASIILPEADDQSLISKRSHLWSIIDGVPTRDEAERFEGIEQAYSFRSPLTNNSPSNMMVTTTVQKNNTSRNAALGISNELYSSPGTEDGSLTDYITGNGSLWKKQSEGTKKSSPFVVESVRNKKQKVPLASRVLGGRFGGRNKLEEVISPRSELFDNGYEENANTPPKFTLSDDVNATNMSATNDSIRPNKLFASLTAEHQENYSSENDIIRRDGMPKQHSQTLSLERRRQEEINSQFSAPREAMTNESSPNGNTIPSLASF